MKTSFSWLLAALISLIHLVATGYCFQRASVIPGTASIEPWQSILAVLAFPLGYLANIDVGFDPAILLAITNSVVWGLAGAFIVGVIRRRRSLAG